MTDQIIDLFNRGLLRNLVSPTQSRVIINDRLLGSGGYGVVLLGHYVDNDNLIAVKIFPLTSDAINSFTREAASYMQLSEFPFCNENIVCMYDAFAAEINDNGNLHQLGILINEYMIGGDLIDRPVTDSEIPVLIYSLLNALNFIHFKGYAHRDIKPDNILSNSPPNSPNIDFKLGDLGLVCTNNAEPTIPRCRYFGTFEYMSPTALMNNNQDTSVNEEQKDDIWQLGVTLYIIIFGRYPQIPGGWTPENIENLTQETLSRAINENTVYPRTGTGVVNNDVIIRILSSTLQVDPERRPTAGWLFNYFKNNILVLDRSLSTVSIYNYIKSLGRYAEDNDITDDFRRKAEREMQYIRAYKEYDSNYLKSKYDKYVEYLDNNEHRLTEGQLRRYRLIIHLLELLLPEEMSQ